MQSAFTNALSMMAAKHVRLSGTRQETLCWLVLLMLRLGTVTLWRLAAHVQTAAQTDSVRRRFYRFFQKVHLDAGIGARMVVSLLGLEGKPWVLAIDRTNWDRSEEHTSELQSLMRISYAVFCLKKKIKQYNKPMT